MWEGGPTSISHWRVGLARLGSSGLGKVRLARLGSSSGSRSSSAFRTSFVPSLLILLVLRGLLCLQQTMSRSRSCSEPPTAGGGGGAGTEGRVHLTSCLAPLTKIELFPSSNQNLKDLSSRPPPGLQDVADLEGFLKVMQTPGTSSPPPPATAQKGKGDADTAAPDLSTANMDDLRGRARRLLFGRLRGRGWPGGSVSGRLWLGVGRDDDYSGEGGRV